MTGQLESERDGQHCQRKPRSNVRADLSDPARVIEFEQHCIGDADASDPSFGESSTASPTIGAACSAEPTSCLPTKKYSGWTGLTTWSSHSSSQSTRLSPSTGSASGPNSTKSSATS